MKKILLISFLLIFSSFVLAYTPQDIYWKGYINLDLDKTIFEEGEPIKGSLYIYNLDEYPILAQKIVMQVGSGIYDYPSQFAEDNTVYEEIIETSWILPNSIKRIDFNIENTFSGENHIDVYSWISKSKFNGASSIYLNPTIQNFKVSNEKNENVFINRKLTNFGKEKQIGPVGFPVEPLEVYPGEIYITNPTKNSINNLSIEINVCDWAEAFCNDTTKIINIGNINGEETKKVDVELTANEIPSAYSINMKLKQDNEVISIYKNRLIVTGGTAKIRKIVFDGLVNRNYSIFALIAGSPDHFTYPNFENFEIKLKVFLNNNLIEENKNEFRNIDAGEIIDTKHNITADEFDYICLSIEKSNNIYDEECFKVELEELQNSYDEKFPEELNIKYQYDEEDSVLEIILSKEIKKSINVRLKIINQISTLISEDIKSENSTTINYNVPRQDLTLLIDDIDAKKQYTIDLDFAENKSTLIDTNELISCPAVVCSNGTVCATQTVNSKEGACCYSYCTSALEEEGQLGTTPLILIISIFLVLIAIIILANILIKGRGKK